MKTKTGRVSKTRDDRWSLGWYIGNGITDYRALYFVRRRDAIAEAKRRGFTHLYVGRNREAISIETIVQRAA